MNLYTLDLSQFAPWQWAALAVLAASLVAQLFYYFFFFIRLSFYKVEDEKMGTEPVTVIICAWNEEDNLRAHLESVLNQDHPKFEVIVVNDHSTDETDILLHEWQKAFPHLHAINLNRENANIRGKKFAISMGIKGAKYDRLVFTDADCRPSSDKWLRHMCAAMTTEKKVVLGYGGFEKLPGLLNKLYRYEAVHIALQYFTYALAKQPYMGVGRNMAYRKELFFETKGFIKHRHIASGDDDLLVNEVSTGTNTTIVMHPDAHTISLPKNTWGEWWTQKRRHLSTSGLYRWDSQIFLGIYNVSAILFYGSFCAVLSIPVVYWSAFVALFIKWTCHLSIMRAATRLLRTPDLFLFSLLGDVFSPFFNAFASLSTLIKRPIVWK